MKGQISSEFLVVYSALFAIFIVVFTIYLGGNFNLAQIQDSAIASTNAQTAAAAYNYVYLAGSGASYNVTMSLGNNESVSIYNHSIQSSRTFASSYASILDSKRNSSTLVRGYNIISNNAGEIDIK